MTKQKSTKKAFLSSFLSLVLCMAMLIGTTFAWFTDSVASSNNKIESGSLKIDLELLDKETSKWNSLKESKAAIFNYDNWEPGYTDVKILKVENEGTLALKWMAKFVSAAKLTKLADVIDVYVCPSEEELSYPADRTLSGYTRVGTVAEFVNTIETTTTGTLEAKEDAYLGIALKMQESAGNEYQEMSLGGEFDIQILATQLTSELDSFDDQYDKDATYIPAWDGMTVTEPKQDAEGVYHITNGAELAYINTILAGLVQEGSIKVSLDADINLGNVVWTPIGTADRSGAAFIGTFDGNGHTIYNVNVDQTGTTYSMRATTMENVGLFGSVMYKGTVIKDLTVENVSVRGGERTGALVGSINGAEIVNCHVINGNVEGSATTNAKVGGLVGTLIGSILKNCSISDVVVASNYPEDVEGSVGIAGALVGRVQGGSGITPAMINNSATDCTVIAGQAGEVYGANIDTTATLEANLAKNIEVINDTIIVSDGLIRDTANNYFVYSAAGMNALNGISSFKGVKTISLLSDLDMTGYTWNSIRTNPDNGSVLSEINGNGHTISNMTINGQGIFNMLAVGGELTIKDIVFDNANVDSNGSINTSLICSQVYNDLVLDNVDVKNSSVTGGYKVATLVATVYNESSSEITLTVRNCDVDNCTVTTTKYDFMTCGLVAFVYEDDNDKVVFENTTISNTKLVNKKAAGYEGHAFVYATDSEPEYCYNSAEGVVVTDCEFIGE